MGQISRKSCRKQENASYPIDGHNDSALPTPTYCVGTSEHTYVPPKPKPPSIVDAFAAYLILAYLIASDSSKELFH